VAHKTRQEATFFFVKTTFKNYFLLAFNFEMFSPFKVFNPEIFFG